MAKQLVLICFILLQIYSCAFPHIPKIKFYFEPDIPATDNKIIPLNRRIEWDPGIAGRELPNYPNAINVQNPPYSAVGNGSTDDTISIQSAIDDCPVGNAVYLPAGNYLVSNRLSIMKGIVLRGAGPSSTRITLANVNSNILQLGNGSMGPAININSGYEKGSTRIIVANAATINIGEYIILYQDNLSGLVTIGGYLGDCTWCGVEACTWCGDPPSKGNHAMSQIVKVISKTGNTLILNRPVYFGFSHENDPEIVKIDMVSGIGIEDLSIERSGEGTTGGLDNIKTANIAYSWIKNVNSYNCVTTHIKMTYSYGCEIINCYLFDAFVRQGSRACGIDLFGPNSDILVENNKILRCAPSFAIEGGGSGCVVAYNYMRESYYDNSPGWFIANLILHGAHPYMNLFEGNVFDGFTADVMWGSSSHNTLFRNYITRTETYPVLAMDGVRAINIQESNYYFNFIGNVFCKPGDKGSIYAPSCTSNNVIWRIGCHSPSTGEGLIDPYVDLTLIGHGNFNYITNTVQWEPKIREKIIPASFYLKSKPSFFGSLSWPPIGPDISNKNNKIPAEDITG